MYVAKSINSVPFSMVNIPAGIVATLLIVHSFCTSSNITSAPSSISTQLFSTVAVLNNCHLLVRVFSVQFGTFSSIDCLFKSSSLTSSNSLSFGGLGINGYVAVVPPSLYLNLIAKG